MNEQNSPLFGYDPDSLADRLDQLFPPDSDFVSEAGLADADPLIDMAGRLAAAPKLELSADALVRIQARMNAAIPTPESPPQPAKPRPILRWPVIVLAAAAVMALTLVVVGRLVTTRDETRDQVAQQSTETAAALVILTETSTTAVPTVAATDEATIASTSTPEIVPIEPTPTLEAVTQATEIPTTPPITLPTTEAASPTPSEVPATVTDTATATTVIIVAPTDTVVVTQVMVASPTFTPSPVDTAEPVTTLPPTVVATAVDTVEPTATVTPTPLPGHLILEGQIDAIEANVIDIYGIRVSVDEDDPLLKVLRVEDFVRVEGSFEDIDGMLIVEVFTIELVTEDGEGIDVTVNPANPGEMWRDSGDCSNPPPSWAPANGWRRRCENTGGSGNNPGGNGQGNQGGGKGNDGEDEDD